MAFRSDCVVQFISMWLFCEAEDVIVIKGEWIYKVDLDQTLVLQAALSYKGGFY
jgi:hypothetical protein